MSWTAEHASDTRDTLGKRGERGEGKRGEERRGEGRGRKEERGGKKVQNSTQPAKPCGCICVLPTTLTQPT